MSLDFFHARADLKKKQVAWAFGTFSIIQETRRGRLGNEISHCMLTGCPGEDLDVDCGVAFVVASYATSSTSDSNPFGGGSSSYTFEGSVQYIPDSSWLLRIGVEPDHLVYQREGLEQISNNPPGHKSLGYVVPDVRRRVPTSDVPADYPNPDDSG